MYSPQNPLGQAPPQGPGPNQQQPFSMGSRASTGFIQADSPASPPSQPASQGYAPLGGPPDPSQSFQQQHNRQFSHGPPGGPPTHQQPQFDPRNAPQGGHRYGNGGSISASGPPQLNALSFQGGSPTDQRSPPQHAAAQFQGAHDRQPSGAGAPGPSQISAPAPGPGPSAPSKPVFGVTLDRLYERDGLAVPMVVHQCIQAVEHFGLGVEGIYRHSGSVNHIQKLKTMFDTGNVRDP